MKINKILIVLLLLIFTIGAVSATDENMTSDSLTVNEEENMESINQTDEYLVETQEGTFTELAKLIENVEPINPPKTLELDKDYVNTGFEKEITIKTSMTIDGKGHTINANNTSRIFKIESSEIILKNIIFTNGNSDYGGAIDLNTHHGYSNYNCNFDNCSFINCSAKYGGGAVSYRDSEDCVINNCTFINCHAPESGAIYFSRSGWLSDGAGHGGLGSNCRNNIIRNSNFINCSASDGGAFCFYDLNSSGTISNCNFINCRADNGGAIYFYPFYYYNDNEYYYYYFASSGIISDCNFINCNANYGGAINIGSTHEEYTESYGMNNDAYSTVINCNFMNCYAITGGSIYWNCNNGKIENSNFTSSYAKNGGAVYASENINLAILNSNFNDNNADEFGSAIYGGVVSNCNFSGNTYPEIYNLFNYLELYVYQSSGITNCPITIHPPRDTAGNISIYVLEGDNYTFIDCMNFSGDTTIYLNATKLGDMKIKAICDTNYGKFESYAQTNVSCIEFGYSEYPFFLNTPYPVKINLPKDAKGNFSLYVSDELYECINITNGTATINFKTETAGIYLLKAVCDCNYGFENASNEVTFKDGTRVYIYGVYEGIYGHCDEMFYKDNKRYDVEVRGLDGELVSNANVNIKIGSTNIKAKTNVEGIASVSISKLKPGKHKITAAYKNFKESRTLTVKHILKLKTVKVKKSAKKLVLSATLKNKKPIKGKTIKFKFKGKTYKAKTNKKGIAKVTIKKSVLKKLKVGKKVTYQATYIKDTVKKTAKVKK